MKNLLRLLCAVVVVTSLVACADDSSGDVEAARAASAAGPQSVEELPQDMDPRARKSAEAAMKQSEARKAAMDAQADAMRKARASAGK